MSMRKSYLKINTDNKYGLENRSICRDRVFVFQSRAPSESKVKVSTVVLVSRTLVTARNLNTLGLYRYVIGTRLL